jgi:hypothetical protein
LAPTFLRGVLSRERSDGLRRGRNRNRDLPAASQGQEKEHNEEHWHHDVSAQLIAARRQRADQVFEVGLQSQGGVRQRQ